MGTSIIFLKGYNLKHRNLQREKIQFLVTKHARPPNALTTSSLEFIVACCRHESPARGLSHRNKPAGFRLRSLSLSSVIPDTVCPIAAAASRFPQPKAELEMRATYIQGRGFTDAD